MEKCSLSNSTVAVLIGTTISENILALSTTSSKYMLWVELRVLKRYIQILTLSICECELIWK